MKLSTLKIGDRVLVCKFVGVTYDTLLEGDVIKVAGCWAQVRVHGRFLGIPRTKLVWLFEDNVFSVIREAQRELR